jgi:hypothetical protein
MTTATPNYGWLMPVDGGDENTWGTESITLWGAQDASLKLVENKADTAVAYGTRITALEADVTYGHAGWKTGLYYFGATCEGIEEELVALTAANHYVPFDHLGTFVSMFIRGGGTTIKAQVVESSASGAPTTTILGEVNFAGVWSGTKEISFTSPITITRPVWLNVLTDNIYTRGTTGVPSRWRLGSASSAPSAAADAITCARGIPGALTAISLGTKGWGPTLGLKTS